LLNFWARVFPVTFAVLFVAFGGLVGLRLALDYSETVGVIREWQPQNHNSVVVSYAVDGRQETIAATYPGVDAPTIGANLSVYYARSDPSVASLQRPPAAFSSGVLGIAAASALVALAIAGFVRKLRGGRGSAASS
jgi:hypothetical protein